MKRTVRNALVLAAGLALLALFLALCLRGIRMNTRVPVTAQVAKALFAFMGVMTAVFGGVFFLLKKKPSFALSAAAVFFAAGLAFIILIPSFSSPDERGHFLAAYELSDKLMGTPSRSEDGRVMVRAADAFSPTGDMHDAYLSENVSGDDYAFIRANLFTKPAGSGMLAAESLINGPSQKFSLARLPQAIGITLARLFGASYPMLLYMGRFFGLLAWTALLYAALRLYPKGQKVMAACAMLPMFVQLAGTYSLDACLNACAFVYVAYVLRLRDQSGSVTGRQSLLLVMLTFACTLWKPVQILLALLCFLIPAKHFGSRKQYWLTAGGCLAALFAGQLAGNLSSLSWVLTSTNAELSWQEGSARTLSYLLAHPAETFLRYADTVRTMGDYHFMTFTGMYPACIDPEIAFYGVQAAGLSVLLFLSSVPEAGQTPVLAGWKERGLAVLLVFGLVLACYMSMDVGWTPETEWQVLGIQGRYYLCVAPVLLFAAGGLGMSVRRSRPYALLMALWVLDVTVVMRVLERIAVR